MYYTNSVLHYTLESTLYSRVVCIKDQSLSNLSLRTLPRALPPSLHPSSLLRNFEGRIHPHTRANYLASPLFVIAYAIAGRVDIDFETEPLATLDDGKQVLLQLNCSVQRIVLYSRIIRE